MASFCWWIPSSCENHCNLQYYPSHSPSPKLADWCPKSAGLPSPTMWLTRKCPTRDPQTPTRDPQGVTWPVWWGGWGGEKCDFFKYSLINGYFKRPILQNCRAKLAPTLLQCQSPPSYFPRAVRSKYPAYIVTCAYIMPPKWPIFLSLQCYILQATSLQKAVHIKNKASHNSTCGTVSSLFFSCWKVLLHTVYIFNIFYVDWG